MNCPNCNMPLEENARFCRNCGTPISVPPSANAPTIPETNAQIPQQQQQPWSQSPQQQQPSQQPWPQSPQQQQPSQQPWSQPPQQQQPSQQPWSQPPQQQQPSQQPWSQPTVQQPPTQPQQVQGGQLGYYQPNVPASDKQTSATGEKKPRKRTVGGRLLRIGIVLLVIVLLVTGGWFLALRPFLNNMAKSQIDQALTKVVDSIPPVLGLVPTKTLPVPQAVINTAISLNGQSSGIASNPSMSITPSQLKIAFTVFGFPCAITGVPIAQNGKIVVTNVSLEGIMTWILSSDDITTIFNQHLADVATKLNRSVTKVQLQDQAIVLTLNASSLPVLPGLTPVPGSTGTPTFPFPITPPLTPPVLP